MNESTILNGFVNAPSKYNNKFKKPWLNFTNDKIISTNGISLLSVDKDYISTVYYENWDAFGGHEPLMGLPDVDEDRYFRVSENFYSDILSGSKGDVVNLTIHEKTMKFRWDCLVPIYNACRFWEDSGDFFIAFSGIKNPLLIKHESKKISMAIMPLI